MVTRKLYNKRKKEGKCPNCGGKRDDPNLVYCSKCRKSTRRAYKNYYLQNKDQIRRNQRKNYLRVKRKALQMISGEKEPKCKRCGCSFLEVLEINHKNLGGYKEGYVGLPWKIVQGKRPVNDLEVLCGVCNKTHYLEKKTGLKWKIKFTS